MVVILSRSPRRQNGTGLMVTDRRGLRWGNTLKVGRRAEPAAGACDGRVRTDATPEHIEVRTAALARDR